MKDNCARPRTPSTPGELSSTSSVPRPSGLVAGPVLFALGANETAFELAALVVAKDGVQPSELLPAAGNPVLPSPLYRVLGHQVWRYQFALPADRDTSYELNGIVHHVVGDFGGALRVAYVSCNGQEEGDSDRDPDERNSMWRRLLAEHQQAPFSLLLHGGDQLYGDEVLKCHPTFVEWTKSDLAGKGKIPLTSEAQAAAESYYFRRYVDLYSQTIIAEVLAQVPSLMMWDDHDIIDGWGSLPVESLDSPIGRGLFAAARRMFMLFQLCVSIDQPPKASELNLRSSLTYARRFPGFSVIVPDLRSSRRPDRVMDDEGWGALERALDETPHGDRVLLMSSVPIIGPRFSWVEKLMRLVPHAQRFEDDLRDQWQSRTHREEWRRVLRLLERHTVEIGTPVTVLSGEIHLATRGEMALKDGSRLWQLVASGIAHPPPPTAYARCLGSVAAFERPPLQGQPIVLRPLPGQRGTYTNQRNYLVLARVAAGWNAAWELEHGGRTPTMQL